MQYVHARYERLGADMNCTDIHLFEMSLPNGVYTACMDCMYFCQPSAKLRRPSRALVLTSSAYGQTRSSAIHLSLLIQSRCKFRRAISWPRGRRLDQTVEEAAEQKASGGPAELRFLRQKLSTRMYRARSASFERRR